MVASIFPLFVGAFALSVYLFAAGATIMIWAQMISQICRAAHYSQVTAQLLENIADKIGALEAEPVAAADPAAVAAAAAASEAAAQAAKAEAEKEALKKLYGKPAQ